MVVENGALALASDPAAVGQTARVVKLGDLWKPLLAKRGRFDLAPLVAEVT